MKNTDHSAALRAAMHEAMHEAMLETHELISPRDLPGFVARWEADNNAPAMDADTIREALRSASDAFVDSMVNNEHDTRQEPHLDPLDKRVARWEVLRPVNRRTAELAAALAAPAPAPDPQDAPLPPDPDGMNEDRAGWARQALEHFRNVTGSDAEDALTDLLANLRHLCDREPGTYGTYEDADARAAGMYAEEITPYPAPAPAPAPAAAPAQAPARAQSAIFKLPHYSPAVPRSFDALEVHTVIEEADPEGGTFCEALPSNTEIPEGARLIFSLYGHTPGEGVECIGDFTSFDAACDFATRLGGV